jgi:predicted aspartyl protease
MGTVSAYIDTGFDGYLAVPAEHGKKLGLGDYGVLNGYKIPEGN